MRFIVFLTFLFCSFQSTCSECDTSNIKDSVKRGWNFGFLPALSFDTDLGFQYGAVVNAFHYGDGSRYPKYNHSLYFEFSRYTKGSGIKRFFYDSDKLLKSKRITFDVSYLTDEAFNFIGFNGQQSIYDLSFIDKDDKAQYKSRLFYAYKRNLFRCEPIIQDTISGHFNWIAGFGIYHYQISTLDIDNINKGKVADDTLPHIPVLYDKYIEWGLISSDEARGGWFNHLITGIAYDTRDKEANPSRGVRDELLLASAPRFMGNKTSSFKLTLSHKQFFTLVPKKLTFCYRFLWQSNIGATPWYAKQLILKSYPVSAYSEGVGGSKSVRGIVRYRLVGNDVAFTNIEFRYLFAYCRLFKQNIHLGLNPFYDAGMVTRFIPLDLSAVSESEKKQYLKDTKKDIIHQSAGLGFRFIMNENFIVAFEYGKAFLKSDGKSGFYINLNYLF